MSNNKITLAEKLQSASKNKSIPKSTANNAKLLLWHKNHTEVKNKLGQPRFPLPDLDIYCRKLTPSNRLRKFLSTGELPMMDEDKSSLVLELEQKRERNFVEKSREFRTLLSCLLYILERIECFEIKGDYYRHQLYQNLDQEHNLASLPLKLLSHHFAGHSINIANNQVNPFQLNLVGALVSNNPNLTRLSFYNCNLNNWGYPSPSTMEFARAIEANSTLTGFYITCCAIEKNDLKIITSALQKNTALKKVKLSCTNLDASFVINLINNNKTITYLNFLPIHRFENLESGFDQNESEQIRNAFLKNTTLTSFEKPCSFGFIDFVQDEQCFKQHSRINATSRKTNQLKLADVAQGVPPEIFQLILHMLYEAYSKDY